ncbi:MAG TPA: 2-dehydropantoate 2-reductase [Baekduia sp.]|uniref:ketopantoate reductase family protein n=1 Tax=Baekduia sp. TaxID=2600305 RepID=UPI002B8D569E|nr:2-dehydropantoate 2-reductase [Baekduia sp.]HMJ32557.1 2-dehydropantoate 2-reductase [Baekduia sp.]
MRIAIVGAGAIGTWIGAALARAGHDVALLARGTHLEALRRDGVRVLGAGGDDYVVHPLATDDPQEVGAVDAVVLAVKAHDQRTAAPAVRALLGPDASVVGAQNGMPWWYFHGLPGPYEGRHIESVDPRGAVSALLPPARAIGMVVYLGARIVAPGVVETRPEAGLVIGEPSGAQTVRLQAVAGALADAGFPVRVTPDIRTEIWTKLMGNVSFNPISLLTRAGLGAMASDEGVRVVIARLMAEAVEVARAVGADPSMSIEERLALTERLGDHRTSTLQDLEAGKRLELDALTGAVVELADLAGVAAPALRTIHALVDLEARTLGLR